jgi:hypothetical protein
VTSFTVVGNQEMQRLTRRWRQAADGRDLRQRWARELRDAGRDVVADMQQTIRTMNVRGVRGGGRKRRSQFNAARRLRGSSGLRATVARGVKQSIRTTGAEVGWRIFVDNSHMPRSQRNLPAHLDNPRGWRHPTFGRRGSGDWARQFGTPYFDVTVARHRRRLVRVVWVATDEHVRGLA